MIQNVNRNAPWWWKRLETALLVGLIPTYTGFITSIPMPDHDKVWMLAGGAFFGGIVKSIGLFLGDKKDENNV